MRKDSQRYINVTTSQVADAASPPVSHPGIRCLRCHTRLACLLPDGRYEIKHSDKPVVTVERGEVRCRCGEVTVLALRTSSAK
jgi:hypothetical protein